MSNVMNWLMDYAFDHQISVILTRYLNPHMPSISDGNNRLTVINMNWHNKNEIPFCFAHEIGHILNGDQGQHKFSAHSVDIKEEYQANLTGTKLLIRYAKSRDINIGNPVSFCEQFGIPTELEYVVALEMK